MESSFSSNRACPDWQVARRDIRPVLSIVLLLLLQYVMHAQDMGKPYYFDGDDVVFVFDTRDYASAIAAGTGETMDFSDLKIHDVAVSGDFDDWNADDWKMEKVDRHTYRLRKKISDFNDHFPVEFKYVINEEYWARPGATFPESMKFSNDFIARSYNLDLHQVEPLADGNTVFFLGGHPRAEKVILTGDFVEWDEDYLKMYLVPGGWEMRIDLAPGKYLYKFIVDGEWTHDPENPSYQRNEHGTLNSILQIATKVEFKLEGHADADEVLLAGSFNQWSRVPMSRDGDTWRISLSLAGGKHFYKFIVDGRWILDPDNRMKERDHQGIPASVMIIR